MITVIHHPLIQVKLTQARDERCNTMDFRRLVSEIAGLMLFEVARDYPLVEAPIRTPVAVTVGHRLAREIVLIPILRAGLVMTQGLLDLIPDARVGHLGFMRDENTLKPIPYYSKLPANLAQADVILVDPMLATGGSASAAAAELRRSGAVNLKLLCLVAAPEGVARMTADHPDVHIFTAALDHKLTDHGYIVPGLGDAGDRLFGTV